MIAQIRKFKTGGNNTSTYKELYEQAASANGANNNNKLNSENFISYMLNVGGKKDAEVVYKYALQLLNGNPLVANSNIDWVDREIKRILSHNSSLSNNEKKSQTSTGTWKPIQYKKFDSNYFANPIYTSDVLGDRVVRSINKIIGSLENAEKWKRDGIEVLDYNLTSETAQNIIKNLAEVSGGLESGKINEYEAYEALSAVAKNLPGYDSSLENEFFGLLIVPPLSVQNKLKLLVEGYNTILTPEQLDAEELGQNLKKWLETNKFQIASTKDNNWQLTDSQFAPVQNKFYIDVNPFSTAYNKGIYSDGAGNIYRFDYNDSELSTLPEDVRIAIKDLANKLKTQYENAYHKRYIPINPNIDLQNLQEIKLLYDHFKDRSNTNIDFLDVANWFQYKTPVIAYSDTGKIQYDLYGRPENIGNLKYVFTKDGKLYETDIQNAQKILNTRINLQGHNPSWESSIPQMRNYDHIFAKPIPPQLLLDLNTDIAKYSWMEKSLIPTAISGLVPGPAKLVVMPVVTEATKLVHDYTTNTIAESPLTFVNLVMQYIKDPDAKISLNNSPTSHSIKEILSGMNASPTKLFMTAGMLVNNKSASLSAEDYNLLKRAAYNSTKSNNIQETEDYFKDGGVVRLKLDLQIRNSEQVANKWHKMYTAKHTIDPTDNTSIDESSDLKLPTSTKYQHLRK